MQFSGGYLDKPAAFLVVVFWVVTPRILSQNRKYHNRHHHSLKNLRSQNHHPNYKLLSTFLCLKYFHLLFTTKQRDAETWEDHVKDGHDIGRA
jgi:hypothetical protein